MLIYIAVARVAYLTSDIVVSVQPSLQTDSWFSKPLKALKQEKARSILPKGVPDVSDTGMQRSSSDSELTSSSGGLGTIQ